MKDNPEVFDEINKKVRAFYNLDGSKDADQEDSGRRMAGSHGRGCGAEARRQRRLTPPLSGEADKRIQAVLAVSLLANIVRRRILSSV